MHSCSLRLACGFTAVSINAAHLTSHSKAIPKNVQMPAAGRAKGRSSCMVRQWVAFPLNFGNIRATTKHLVQAQVRFLHTAKLPWSVCSTLQLDMHAKLSTELEHAC